MKWHRGRGMDPDAIALRENTGSTGIVETARTAAATLAEHLNIAEAVRPVYLELWDALRAET